MTMNLLQLSECLVMFERLAHRSCTLSAEAVGAKAVWEYKRNDDARHRKRRGTLLTAKTDKGRVPRDGEEQKQSRHSCERRWESEESRRQDVKTTMKMMRMMHSQQRCKGLVVVERLGNRSRARIANGIDSQSVQQSQERVSEEAPHWQQRQMAKVKAGVIREIRSEVDVKKTYTSEEGRRKSHEM